MPIPKMDGTICLVVPLKIGLKPSKESLFQPANYLLLSAFAKIYTGYLLNIMNGILVFLSWLLWNNILSLSSQYSTNMSENIPKNKTISS